MDQLVQHEVLSIANKAVALCAELEAQPGVDAISVGFVRSKLQAASEKLHLIPLLADDVVRFIDELNPALPVLAVLAETPSIVGTPHEIKLNIILAYMESLNALASAMMLHLGATLDKVSEPVPQNVADLPQEIQDMLQAEGVKAQDVKVVHLGQVNPDNLDALMDALRRMSEGK